MSKNIQYIILTVCSVTKDSLVKKEVSYRKIEQFFFFPSQFVFSKIRIRQFWSKKNRMQIHAHRNDRLRNNKQVKFNGVNFEYYRNFNRPFSNSTLYRHYMKRRQHLLIKLNTTRKFLHIFCSRMTNRFVWCLDFETERKKNLIKSHRFHRLNSKFSCLYHQIKTLSTFSTSFSRKHGSAIDTIECHSLLILTLKRGAFIRYASYDIRIANVFI